MVNLALVCSGDARSGAELSALLRDSMKMSNDELREIAFLHDARDVPLPSDAPSMRVFRASLPELRQSRFVDYSAGIGRDVSQFELSISELLPLRAGNAPLVDGNTLSEVTGLEPGPRMGRLKAMLHRFQIERDLANRDEVLSLLDELDWRESEHEGWPSLSWP